MPKPIDAEPPRLPEIVDDMPALLDAGALIQSLPDGVLLFDAEGRLRHANSRFDVVWPSAERGFEPGADLDRTLLAVMRHARPTPCGAGQAGDFADRVACQGDAVTAISLEVAGRSLLCRVTRTAAGGTMLTFSPIDGRRDDAPTRTLMSDTLFDAVARQMPGLIGQIDGDGRYVFANRTYSDWYGVPVDRIVGRTDEEWMVDLPPGFPDEPWHRSRRANIRSALSGRTVEFEEFRSYPDGHDRYVRGALVPLLDDDGAVRGVSIVTIDISEEKRREKALSESEERYRSLVELSPSYLLVHRDGECLFANPATQALYGVERGDTMVGRQMMELVHPDSRAAILDRYKTVMSEHAPLDRTEVRARRVDGTEFLVENRVACIQWDGEPAVLVVGSDISDLKRAEQRIRDSERMFRGLVDASFDAVIISVRGKVVGFNAKALGLYGYDETEMTGLDVLDLVPDDRHEFARYRIETEASDPYESFSRARDGRRFPVEISARTFVQNNRRIRVAAVRDLTQRKQAEDALRTSEHRFRDFAEASGDWFWETDLEQRFTYVSPRGDPDQSLVEDRNLIGRSRTEIHAEFGTDATVAPRIQAYMDRGEPFRDVEMRVTEPDGQVQWLQLSGQPVSNEFGEVASYRGVGVDITARKRAEEALRKSEAALARAQARLIDAIESLPLGFNLFDEEDRLVMSNSAMHALYPDYSPLFTAGTKFGEILRFGARRLPDDVDAEQWARERFEKFADPDGSEEERIAEGSWTRVSYRKTSEGGTVEIRYDITERKRAEDALRESEERYRRLAQLLPDAVRVVTGDRLVFANAAAAKLLGATSPEQLFDLPGLYFLDPDDHDVVDDRIATVKRGDSVPWREHKMRGLGGKEFTVESAMAPIVWDGKPSRILVHRDTTRHKQVENQLRRAMEEAKQANVAKSRFLAAASHDLRQPIQALGLLNAALAYEVEDPSQKEITANMSHAIDAMRSVLDGLLDISKLEAGVVTPEFGVFPIAPIIDRIAGELSFEAQAKGLDLRVVPSSVCVRSDRDLLERVLQNFVSNAIRYTEQGRVLIGCRRHGGDLHLQVWDTGPGIGADQQDRIFEEFYQLDNPARDRSKGLGLGLAIVDRLARLLDHPVQVRSELGQGSMFSIVLPIESADAMVADEPEPLPRIELDGKRILVVDDDDEVVVATMALLSRWGAEASGANSADEALLLATKAGREPDLVIVDYVLADGATGTDVIRRLDEALGFAVPRIVISGDVSSHLHDEVRSAGSVLLHKPVNPAKLRSLIHHLLLSGG